MLREFHISMTSFQQVHAFVALAIKQPFEVLVGNEHQSINGKDFMGMFSLDYSRPVSVRARCSEEEFLRFRQDAAQIVV